MSPSSTSSSSRPSRATQPSCAQLDASYSPARLASRNTSEDEDSDSSASRLPRQEANDNDTDVNIDGDSGRGVEDELETAPRRRRPRVTEYIPRRRNHGELRELVEGVDYDLTDLHEPDQAQPLTTAASISGPQLGAPGTPIDIDADHSFRFPIPARQYSWAGSSMLYDSTNSQ